MTIPHQRALPCAVSVILICATGGMVAGCANSNSGGPSAPGNATLSTPGKQGHGPSAPKALRTTTSTSSTTGSSDHRPKRKRHHRSQSGMSSGS